MNIILNRSSELESRNFAILENGIRGAVYSKLAELKVAGTRNMFESAIDQLKEILQLK